MGVNQSFCYGLFLGDGMSLDQLCAEAARIGYPAIELWARGPDFDELMAAAQRHKLTVASMSAHGTLTDGLNKRENHDRIEAETRQSLEIAKKHGIGGLICFSGNRQRNLSPEQSMQNVVDGLKRLAPWAEKCGVNLNMELLNSRVDHPGYECDRTAWGVEVCKRVGSDRAKLLYDIYHMQIMEGDIIRTIRDNIRFIGHFHTAGNPGRNDMDQTQELNYLAISRAIAQTGYKLYVGHEFKAKGDKIEALAEAFKLFNQ